MGCGGSKRGGCCGENRPEELVKCAAYSSEVRWSWLRGHALFTFSELRTVLKVFREATSTELTQQHLGKLPPPPSSTRGGGGGISGGGGPDGQAGSRPSIWAPLSACHVKSAASSSPAMMMDKAQFLSLCDSDETFRLSVVVGAFGSRLFDVLDEDGDGRLGFEAFTLGLSKLLKVRRMYSSSNSSRSSSGWVLFGWTDGPRHVCCVYLIRFSFRAAPAFLETDYLDL